MYSYPEETIGGNDYEVLDSVANATIYFGGRLGAEKYNNASSDNKKRAARMALLFMDKLSWKGDKTDADQGHAFPRSGLTDPDTGEDLDEDTIPQTVLYGYYELQLALLKNPNLFGKKDATGSNIAGVSAGPVSVNFFNPQKGGRLPTEVAEFLVPFLSGGASFLPQAYGTSNETSTDDSYDLDDVL